MWWKDEDSYQFFYILETVLQSLSTYNFHDYSFNYRIVTQRCSYPFYCDKLWRQFHKHSNVIILSII